MIAIVEAGSKPRTSLTGVEVGRDVTGSQKTWNIMTAMGNMAFAYAFSMVLIEIQVCHFLLLTLSIIKSK